MAYLAEKGADVHCCGHCDTSILMLAASSNHWEVISILLAHGARLDSADVNGITALMFSCYDGNLEAVKCLRERGADLWISCKDGLTALLYAK